MGWRAPFVIISLPGMVRNPPTHPPAHPHLFPCPLEFMSHTHPPTHQPTHSKAAGLLTCIYVKEPVRGQSESAVTELLLKGGGGGGREVRRLDVQAFLAMLRIRTNIILILQVGRVGGWVGGWLSAFITHPPTHPPTYRPFPALSPGGFYLPI